MVSDPGKPDAAATAAGSQLRGHNMNQKQQDQKFGMRESFNLFYAVAKVHAFCFLPIIR